MNDILNLFYNKILKEAATGRVDCGFMQNFLVETKIYNKTLFKIPTEISNNGSFFIPTLEINNFEGFNDALKEYFIVANDFYKEFNEDIKREAMILCSLFYNATEKDFKNSIEYIKRCTYFLLNPILEINKEIDLGYSNILDSNIYMTLKQEPINEETPYGLYIACKKDNLTYNLPIVRFGVKDNKAYIFAVQHDKVKKKESKENNSYVSRIERKFYKVNENFREEDLKDNIINFENITGISPSPLISLTIALSLLEKMNISDVDIITFLPVRYNAKEMAYLVEKSIAEDKGVDLTSIKDKFHESQEKHEEIQRNLSDKFFIYKESAFKRKYKKNRYEKNHTITKISKNNQRYQ